MKYTKNDFVRLVKKNSKIKIEEALDITDTVLYTLQEMITQLNPGDIIELRGLGVFKMKKINASGHFHNPKTMERVLSSSKRKLTFTPSKVIKRKLLEIEV